MREELKMTPMVKTTSPHKPDEERNGFTEAIIRLRKS
jgi:hypothetical protein